MNSQALQRPDDRRGISLYSRSELCLWVLGVGNPQATTRIDVAGVVSRVAEGFYECSDTLHGLAEGIDVEDLRPDVHADSGGLEEAAGNALAIQLGRVTHRHSELVLVQARGDVRMRTGVDVGIHAYGKVRGLAKMR